MIKEGYKKRVIGAIDSCSRAQAHVTFVLVKARFIRDSRFVVLAPGAELIEDIEGAPDETL